MVDVHRRSLTVSRTSDDSSGIVSQLRDIHARLTAKAGLTDAQSNLLADGIGSYLEAIDEGHAASLDRTMGLKVWGGVSAPRQDRLSRRDTLLRDLWKATPEWRDLSPAVVARLMVQSARRYETQRWPREKFQPEPTAQPSVTWWKVLHSGCKIPGSKRLQQILEEEIQDGV
jgi:hypothetical protein